MKNKNILLLIVIPIMVMIFCTCDETILRDDCADLKNIELTINGTFFTDCEPADVFAARGASLKIIQGKDTLFSGNLDDTGKFLTGPIDSSNCGLNNIKIEANYNGKSIRKEYGVLCCDTTLSYVFENVSCEPPVPVNCASIDTTIVKTITSSGEVVLQNAQFSDLKNNVVILSSKSPVRIELDELKKLNGKIFVESILPANTGNSIVLNGNQLEIYFDVDRSVPDTIKPITIQLPAFCLDANGNNASQGTITITLDAIVSDPNDCYCPFGASEETIVRTAPDKVNIGTTSSFKFPIRELTSGEFGEGCILKIESIKRADGTDAFTKGNHVWTIESSIPKELLINQLFEVTASFAPVAVGDTTEQFEVFTSVYSAANPTIKKNDSDCSFKFSLKGEGCEYVCPNIQVLGLNAKLIDLTNNKERNAPVLKFQMNSNEAISQKLQGKMATDCVNELSEKGEVLYKIDLPNGNYCSDLQLSVTPRKQGPDDDRAFFVPILVNKVLGGGQSTALSITFIPPDLGAYYNTGHDNTYECAFDVIATDNNGIEICRQPIQLESTVTEFSVGNRTSYAIEAFSQKTPKSASPTYQVFKIDEYNKSIGNYGLLQALTEKFIDFTVVPNIPVSNHTFYFDVDSPDDLVANAAQSPELYLVNSTDNNFSKITATAVDNYTSHDAFVAAYKNGTLMSKIINSAQNTGTGNSFNWSNSKESTKDFANGNGIKVKPNEVYVVWDPKTDPLVYSTATGEKNIFCGMALIYISSVVKGDDLPASAGGQGKASVTFYVEYPLQYDKK